MLEQNDFDRIESLIAKHETEGRKCGSWKKRAASVIVVCMISYSSHYVLESKILEGFAQSSEMVVLAFIEWGFEKARKL